MEIRYSSLFSQLLGVIDRSLFGRLVRETEAEKSAKGLSCWEVSVNDGAVLTDANDWEPPGVVGV
jgi:Domain of unknown function (DUF4372)